MDNNYSAGKPTWRWLAIILLMGVSFTAGLFWSNRQTDAVKQLAYSPEALKTDTVLISTLIFIGRFGIV